MEVEKAASGRKQILTALIATVPSFTYGLQIGWLSPMRPLLLSARGPTRAPLTDSDISWMAAALPLAAITGIPAFSYASDRVGRKLTIIAVSFLYSVSWLIKLTAPSAAALIAARVVAGWATAGCFVAVPAYVREVAEDARRGTLGSLVMTVCKLGVIAAYALGAAAGYRANQAAWLAVSAAHALAFSFMPESPSYLVKIGKEAKALQAISWLRDLSKHSPAVTGEVAKLKEELRRQQEMPKISLRTFVRDRAACGALRVTLALMGAQTLSGGFALMTFAADVLARAGAAGPHALAVLVGALQLAGSFATTVTIERFGRKTPLIASAVVMSACMAALGTQSVLARGAAWLPAAAVCLAAFAYGAGLAPVPFVIMAEVFTFELRARMAGVSMAFSFFCSSMTVLFYTPIANQVGPYAVFYSFAAVGLVGAGYTALCVPETKGKTLWQIQAYWDKGFAGDAGGRKPSRETICPDGPERKFDVL